VGSSKEFFGVLRIPNKQKNIVAEVSNHDFLARIFEAEVLGPSKDVFFGFEVLDPDHYLSDNWKEISLVSLCFVCEKGEVRKENEVDEKSKEPEEGEK